MLPLYGCGRGNPSQFFDYFRRANIPSVDDMVGPCELLDRLGAQKTVRVGDYADPHQTPAVSA
jgi:hypothetical protein